MGQMNTKWVNTRIASYWTLNVDLVKKGTQLGGKKQR